MHHSINKKKIYFYLIILLFSSTSFNFTSVSNFKNLNLIKSIDIRGLDYKEEDLLRYKLNTFKGHNIFSPHRLHLYQRLVKNGWNHSSHLEQVHQKKLGQNIGLNIYY